ncbi:MAG: SDR family NAD(P)-dependent oxidoreductase [Candidatus Thiodiazotropha sp. (ex Dulcina madagascariensis)]|nr:SDR family NAD(P)-dependent oxidoreductase [Candidatus Thiodiazotropha sp. (ex Dulcina madagascariensis)]
MREDLYINANHPILKNHKVKGQMLLPGLAYIDLLYQIFREHGYDADRLELRNLAIYHPMVLSENHDFHLSIQCDEDTKGNWRIHVEGQTHGDGAHSAGKITYAGAEMVSVKPVRNDERVDVAALRRSAKGVTPLDQLYNDCRRHELVHEGFMKADGDVYRLESGVLVDIALAEHALPSADGFMFHPVLIDGSAIGAAVLLSALDQDQEALYLPLSYESFRASSLLHRRCLTLVRTDSLIRKNDIVYLTLEFFDQQGQKLGELRNLCNKLVRRGAMGPERDVAKAAGATPESMNKVVLGADEDGGAEQFLRRLMAQRLSRPIEAINPQAGYYEMGLDSSLLLEVVKTIEAKVSSPLAPTLLFEYTTIAELADHLDREYPASFTKSEKSQGRTPSPMSADPRATHVSAGAASEERVKDATQVAIVGIAGRYPGADSIQEFWTNLKEGRDCVTEIPASRWDWRTLQGLTSPSGKKMSKWGGFVSDPDCFDAKFFRISPREAEFMDPQERLFLQTCWEAVEDAGYTPGNIVSSHGANQRRRVGVFVGVMHKDYTLVGAEAVFKGQTVPLSLNTAPIANRVSYFCNFHGPSIAVDTVCSSSLTAVHMAVESIRSGESEVALAGGVNLSLHPGKYMTYGMGDFHSSDGYCHSFGEGGDGYVSSEGVGAIVLKPLHKAIEDKDNIYAVIKGSAVNHVGKVSGITVPSPVGQADVIDTCLKKAGVDPRTISYIEAHGTGTSLGDPIEMQGLIKAYSPHTEERQFCSIGSVKSNIGHAEAAAGISGLSKVALQLRNKLLVPSLHAEPLNPHIDFHNSPFHVQKKAQAWERPRLIQDGREVSVPRRAGISSFGATGSNAHMLLEEYMPEGNALDTGAWPEIEERPHVVPLSARTLERLQVYAEKLLHCLNGRDGDGEEADLDLGALAYTLQTGREAMEERVAFVVADLSDLARQLAGFVANDSGAPPVHRGRVKHGTNVADLLAENGVSEERIATWINTGNLPELAEWWVKGVDMDWASLHKKGPIPNRISLPSYPFAKERYWLPVPDDGNGGLLQASVPIHPLVHANTSVLGEQRYSSVFTGREHYLSDHIIKGRKTLPEFACLEMVREAVTQAVDEAETVRFHDVVWAEPIVAAQKPLTIHTALFPKENGRIAFEIYSECATTGNPLVHAQGYVAMDAPPKVSTWDITVLKAKLSKSTPSPDYCYQAFQAAGLVFGPAYRGAEALYRAEREVLVRLGLPARSAAKEERLVLHPGLMEPAWQGVLASFIEDGKAKALIPSSLDGLDIFADLSAAMWAVVRPSSDAAGASSKRAQYDVDLCNENGTVCARMAGLSFDELVEEADHALSQDKAEVLFVQPAWSETAIKADLQPPVYEQHQVILCEQDAVTVDDIGSRMDGVQCMDLRSDRQGIEERFQYYAVQLFERIKAIVLAKPRGRILLQLLVPYHGEQTLFAGLAALLKTAQLENPRIVGQLIGIQVREAPEQIVDILSENSRLSETITLRYEGDRRWVQDWREMDLQEERLPWVRKGIYLITGGAGGLGLLFAKEIAQQAKGAILILTGRSPLDERKKAALEALKGLGADVEYRRVDVNRKNEVSDLMTHIRKNLGSLNGIIHSAGLIKDNFIFNKTLEEFGSVLDPKVTGLVNLDEASSKLPLDFFILFSSGAGSTGNLGQADYATANAFMDAYAQYRNGLVSANKRQGRTLSIAWPLWKEGGMHVDKVTERMMMQSMGMMAMRTETGTHALYRAFASNQSQVLVMEGDLERMRSRLLSSNADSDSDTQVNDDARKTVRARLAAIVAGLLNVDVADVDTKTGLTEYGFEPLTLAELTDAIHRIHGVELNDSVYLEYSTIDGLADYLASGGDGQVCRTTSGWGASVAPESASTMATARVQAKILERLKMLFGKILKLDPLQIDAEEPLDAYGLDSIMVTQLNQSLSERYRGLSKTLFYEFQTLQGLSQYLLDEHYQECLSWAGMGVDAVSGSDKERNDEGHRRVAPLRTRRGETGPRLDRNQQVSHRDKAIAIVGMSGRLPKANNIEEYWENLKAGRNCIEEIPQDRWDWREFYHQNREEAGALGKSYSKWGAFLEGFERFDPLFFNIAPREAMSMDPQERLFLEESWRAFEDAGYAPSQLTEELRNKIGVYAGITKNGFNLWSTGEAIFNTSFSSLVNRVSYHMDFHGSSVPVDTMCSSALVALHQACRDLGGGEIDMALVGAVNMYLHPSAYIALSQSQMISDRASCDVFGKGGNGFVPSEGVAAVVLKRLADAEQQNDHILGVIRGSAVNHSGRTNGYSVPNPKQQAAVIQKALEGNGIDPRSISYIESAANGSEMGDAIEMTALGEVFQSEGCRPAIGSVKSMLGHGESVSGMAQLLKVILQLQHTMLCPTTRAAEPNENIDFEKTPFTIQECLTDWPAPDAGANTALRRAGINSFGAGGVNAHLVVEEYVKSKTADNKIRNTKFPAVFVLSAKTEQALKRYRTVWIQYLESHPDADIPGVAVVLQLRREAMKHRFACVANNRSELIQSLAEAVPSDMKTYVGKVDRDRIAKCREASIISLMTAGDLHGLAEEWVHGASIPWRQLYGGALPGHISQLPTYPFSQKRYWMNPPDKQAPAQDGSAGFLSADSDSSAASEKEPIPSVKFIPIDLNATNVQPTKAQADGEAVSDNTNVVSLGQPPSRDTNSEGDEFILRTIRKVLNKILYLDEDDEIDIKGNFTDIGLTSITIVTFIHELNREFSLNLRETIVFDYTSIHDLTKYIQAEIEKNGISAAR